MGGKGDYVIGLSCKGSELVGIAFTKEYLGTSWRRGALGLIWRGNIDDIVVMWKDKRQVRKEIR